MTNPVEDANVPAGSPIYFVGVGGSGMAAVAGLFQEAGFKITGSDAGVYPPMSTMLDELGIKVRTPYHADNVAAENPAMFVIANVLSRGNVELEAVLAKNLPYTSFPKMLGDQFLSKAVPCIVTGTHGKTTTSSLLAHVLFELGEDPSFVIGGIPRNFPRSFRLGRSKLFVVEGDEYDTAFFDKGPKFLHYHPKHLILNNLEFDHADIYANLEAIEAQFDKLVAIVANQRTIIANMDDHGVARLVRRNGLEKTVLRVATLGIAPNCAVRVGNVLATVDAGGEQLWKASVQTDAWGDLAVETRLSGRHNLANISQVIACIMSLENNGDLRKPVDKQALVHAIRSFKSVARRLDRLAAAGGIEIYEDFAHHPTAVRLVVEGFRQAYPTKRIVVAFEPRSASQRRNVFQADFAKALGLADRVYIGECPVDKRIPEDGRMNTDEMRQQIGSKAQAFPTNDALLAQLGKDLAPGDAVIFMSSGSFSGAQHKLAKDVQTRFR